VYLKKEIEVRFTIHSLTGRAPPSLLKPLSSALNGEVY